MFEEELLRRLYLNEVTGHGLGPRRRGGAVVARRRTREAGQRLTDEYNLKPTLTC